MFYSTAHHKLVTLSSVDDDFDDEKKMQRMKSMIVNHTEKGRKIYIKTTPKAINIMYTTIL